MALNDRKITVYANPVANLPDHPSQVGFTAAQLKSAFDAIANEEVKTTINGIINDILATIDGASGADQVGATAITDLDGATVQSILESLRNKLKSIVDGSSGADFIGATAIKAGGAVTVRGQLLELLSDITTVNNNESTRIDNELGRVTAESGRVSVEQTRVEADILRGQTVEAIEVNYAPRLTSAEQQINNLVADKIKEESGVFTPVLAGSTVTGVNTYSFQSGVYTRIGNRVFFEIFINLAAKDTAMSGAVAIKGLPFVTKNLSNYRASGAINYNANIMLDATKPYLSYLIIHNQNEIALRKNGDNTPNLAVDATQITNSTGFMLSGNYEV